MDVITPNEHGELVAGKVIFAPGSNLHVIRGAEGIEMFLLLVAGIVAFPAPLRSGSDSLVSSRVFRSTRKGWS
jgi:hypothetical protein